MKIKYFRNTLVITVASSILFSGAAIGKTLIYPLSKYSTPENPQAFYCTATKIEPSYPGDTIFMTNFVQMIKGFQNDGNKIIDADKLNQIYFLAYHDTNLPQYKDESGYVTLTAGTFDFKCSPGTGGRKLVDGPYGKARYSK